MQNNPDKFPFLVWVVFVSMVYLLAACKQKLENKSLPNLYNFFMTDFVPTRNMDSSATQQAAT